MNRMYFKKVENLLLFSVHKIASCKGGVISLLTLSNLQIISLIPQTIYCNKSAKVMLTIHVPKEITSLKYTMNSSSGILGYLV